MSIGYRQRDVMSAACRIIAACPDAAGCLERSDYGFRLCLVDRERHQAYIVYQPERPEIDQEQIIGDVDKAIAWWNSRHERPKPPSIVDKARAE